MEPDIKFCIFEYSREATILQVETFQNRFFSKKKKKKERKKTTTKKKKL